jgi:hypothetical protein
MRALLSPLRRLVQWRAPVPTRIRTRWPKGSTAMRNMLVSGAIVSLRTSPQYVADMRSLIAGTALLLTVFGLAGILALVVGGAFVGRG